MDLTSGSHRHSPRYSGNRQRKSRLLEIQPASARFEQRETSHDLEYLRLVAAWCVLCMIGAWELSYSIARPSANFAAPRSSQATDVPKTTMSKLIACLCPTYKRPEQLRNAIACFESQTYANKILLILDDADQHPAQVCADGGWRLIAAAVRYPNLPAKLNALAALAQEADILVIWEDDDIYLPHHLAAIVEAAATAGEAAYFAPRRVLSNYNVARGHTREEGAAGRFHGAWAYTRGLWNLLDGYQFGDRLDFDQHMGGRCRAEVGVTHYDETDAIRNYGPSYIYRWGHGAYNGSATGEEGYATLWRRLGELPFDRVERTGPQMDDETLGLYSLHGWERRNSTGWRWERRRSIERQPGVVDAPERSARSVEPLTGEVPGEGDPMRHARDILRLETALLDDPDNPDVTLALAQRHAALGAWSAAFRYYRRRSELGGDPAQTWLALYQSARMLDEQNFADPAVIDAYHAAYDFRPSKAEPLIRIAQRCLRSGRNDVAADIAWTAIATPFEDLACFSEPNAYHVQRHVIYLRALLELRRFDDAIEYAETLIARQDTAPDLLRELDELRTAAMRLRADAGRQNVAPANVPGPSPSEAPRAIPAATPRREKRRLCIGMATFDDYDGVYFSVQAIRMFHPEVADDVELLVIDNNPTGRCAEGLKNLDAWCPNYRYVPEAELRGTAVRDLIFREAHADYVLVMDCHVMIVPGALRRLLDYFDAHPDCADLLQGPMLYDDMRNLSTHFEPVWRQGMYGIWQTDPRGEDAEAAPFEIPMQGLGLFACRRQAWPGFNTRFRGFGGEEGYIHEKFRQAGGKALCLPFLRWLHRFHRPLGTPYAPNWYDRVRNYTIGHAELGLDTAPLEAHFRELLGAQETAAIKARIDRELSSPLYGFDGIYFCGANGDLRSDASGAREQFERLGVLDRVIAVAPVRSEAADAGSARALARVLTHRGIVERAKRQSMQSVLIVEDVVGLAGALMASGGAELKALHAREWTVFRFDTPLSAEKSADDCATAYHSCTFDDLLEHIPGEPEPAGRWMRTTNGPFPHLRVDRILERHKVNRDTCSDINEHLDTLRRYAARSSHITEMGVRDGISTWSLLAGKPCKVVSYDVYRSPGVAEVESAAAECGIDFRFIQNNVLEVDIEQTDLLFIDTLHTYDQLRSELSSHGNKSRKYIILHDTATFADVGEDGKRPGLNAAVQEFLARNPDWTIAERFVNNNGLTCLARAPHPG